MIISSSFFHTNFRNIKKGEEIFVNYGYTFSKRHEVDWYFDQEAAVARDLALLLEVKKNKPRMTKTPQ